MAIQNDVWSRRWEALCGDINGRIKEIQALLENRNPNIIPRLDDYDRRKIQLNISLLKCLHDFAQDYFKYFAELPDKAFTPNYSREHVLATILEQIGNDMEVLSRIAHDHFAFAGEKSLRKADALAEEALKLAVGEGWFTLPGSAKPSLPVVLSYYQKAASIRVIPYANALLLGVPYTTRCVDEDYLAIPHEVGHYVFWQGRLNGESIAQTLFNNETLQQSPWSYRWTEEIFADIYGALVAGPYIALSFQDLQLQSLPENLVKDDQDHPTPNVRPYLYGKVLQANNLEASSKMLNGRWDSMLVQLEKKHEPFPNGRNIRSIYFENGSIMPIHTSNSNGHESPGAISNGSTLGKEPIDAAVKTILNLYGDARKNNSIEWGKMTAAAEKRLGRPSSVSTGETGEEATEPADNPDDLAGFLYKRFSEFVQGYDKMPESEAGITCRSAGDLIKEWEALSVPDGEPAWFQVWLASGWTTEGPKCSGGSGVC